MSDTPLIDLAARQQAPTRLHQRLERSSRFLIRAIQASALIGCVLGMVIYAWQAIEGDTEQGRRALDQAASVGQVAAEADLARIDAAASGVSQLLAQALAEDISPDARRALRREVSQQLSGTPVSAILIFGGAGESGAVFGNMPFDVAGAISAARSSQRAGRELLPLELVALGHGRIGNYRRIDLGGGHSAQALFVLRASSFRTALDVGAAAGAGWHAALLNRDGEVVLSVPDTAVSFPQADLAMARQALGWTPLHADESAAAGRVTGKRDGTYLETRAVAGDKLHLVYIGAARPAIAVLAARRYEFMALFGTSMLAILLAVSVIQNEWQRQDRLVRDSDLVTARADITCDLLSAGVIDWSVADASVRYSDGWAAMFAQGTEPASDEIFDWIARIHPDDRLAAREAYQRMLDGKDAELVHRIRIRMSSGLWVQVIERGRALTDAKGQIVRIVLVQTAEPVDGSLLRNAFGGAVRADEKIA